MDLIQNLLLNIGANTESLTKELQKGNNAVNKFTNLAKGVGSALAGAFAVGSIVSAGKEIFSFAQEIDDTIGKIDDLGHSIDLALNAGRAKAIADTFETDIDKVIQSSASVAEQFGISFGDALKYIQEGLALAGPQSEKFLKSIESQAGAYANTGKDAEDYFTVVTNGYRTGAEFEKTLKAGLTDQSTSWKELTSSMNDGQKIQQNLINSSAELNSVWASLFDGTGDLVDNIKIGFNEIATVSLKAIIENSKKLYNWFGDIYNSSILLRGSIQTVVVFFQNLFNLAKLAGKNLIDVWGGIGSIISAVVKGEFSKIPEIFNDTLKAIGSNTIDYAKTMSSNLKDAVNNTLNDKIELIDLNAAEEQGKQAGHSFKKGFNATAGETHNKTNAPDWVKEFEKQKPVQRKATMGEKFTANTGVEGLDATTERVMSNANESIALHQEQLNSLKYDYIDFSSSVVNWGDLLGGMTGQLTASIADVGQEGTKSFGQLAKGIGNAVKKIVAQMLALALSMAIAKSFETSGNPILGAVLAAAASGLVLALFSAIPNFEKGGIHKGGWMVAGDVNGKGGELINTGNSSARIYNAKDTKQILSGSNSSNEGGTLSTAVSGENLLFILNNTLRQRGKPALA